MSGGEFGYAYKSPQRFADDLLAATLKDRDVGPDTIKALEEIAGWTGFPLSHLDTVTSDISLSMTSW